MAKKVDRGFAGESVFKYPLPLPSGTEPCTVMVHHRFAEMDGLSVWPPVVHVGLDPAGVPCLWAEVDPDSKCDMPAQVMVVLTGEVVPGRLPDYHLGTFVHEGHVIHVYSPRLSRKGVGRHGVSL